MVFVLKQDKDTKHTTRYADGSGHNIYLKEDEVSELETPKTVRVTVEKIE
jgi:hypothetical protein